MNKDCLTYKKYDANNMWHKKIMDTDTNYNGYWCKLSPLESKPDVDGKYAFITDKKVCSNENRIKILEMKMVSMDMEIITLKEANEELKKINEEREEMKRKKQYSDILCDCITKVYDIILRKVTKKYNIQAYSWPSLIFLAQDDKNIESYINDIIFELGFSRIEWESIKNFKDMRNKDTHRKPNAAMAYKILECLNKEITPPELINGMKKVISMCE